MSEPYDNSPPTAGDDFPGWLSDAVLGAVVGAWAQDERSRAAAGLVLRVHTATRHAPRGLLLFPPFAAQVLDAERRGWLP